MIVAEKLSSKTLIFELPRLKNRINKLCMNPLGDPTLWDTNACAQAVLFNTKQICKAKIEEKRSSVTCHRCLLLP